MAKECLKSDLSHCFTVKVSSAWSCSRFPFPALLVSIMALLRESDFSPAKTRVLFKSHQLLDPLAWSDIVDHSFLFEPLLSFGF